MILKKGPVETYKLYIGMTDKEELQQLCSTEEFIDIVEEICEDFEISFSMDERIGGFRMSNGKYITERSLVLSISGFNEDQIFQLAEKLKKQLDQESILVTMEMTQMYVVR